MKHHITKEQWGQTNLEQKKVFLNDEAADGSVEEFEHLSTTNGSFEIGKLIQFLGDEWSIKVKKDRLPYNYEVAMIENENLCDKLWEAVKQKLDTICLKEKSPTNNG